MALTCQMTVTPGSYQVGQSQPPMCVLQVYNPNATAVVVTGVNLVFKDPQGVPRQFPVLPPLVPIGVGQTTSVPAGSSINIGPFPLAVASVAAGSSFQVVPPGSQPAVVQGSIPLQMQIFVGARVHASDGSVNEAGSAGLFVSYAIPPPVAFQGGFANFYDPNAAALVAAGVG